MKKINNYILRFFMLVLGLIFFFYFGLAHLLFPDNVLEFFAIPYFQPLLIMKLIGAAGVAFSIALFSVFINPGRNKNIMMMMMVFTGISLVVITFAIIRGEVPRTEWINAVLLMVSFFTFLYGYGKI